MALTALQQVKNTGRFSNFGYIAPSADTVAETTVRHTSLARAGHHSFTLKMILL